VPDRDDLERMREHVDTAYASAERLVREAEAEARRHAAGVPPRGWAGEEPRPAGPGAAVEALQALAGLREAARGLIPPEIAAQLAAALRELLVALRALVDWYLSRLDAPAGGEPGPAREVQDIPID
jgi:hypothetical protein